MKHRDRRLPCRYDTIVMVSDRAIDVQVLNVSSTGALVRGLTGVENGTAVRFRLLGSLVDATVVRIGTAGGIGLRFARELSTREVKTIRHAYWSGAPLQGAPFSITMIR